MKRKKWAVIEEENWMHFGICFTTYSLKEAQMEAIRRSELYPDLEFYVQDYETAKCTVTV